jgi:hypothetical protein
MTALGRSVMKRACAAKLRPNDPSEFDVAFLLRSDFEAEERRCEQPHSLTFLH